MQYGRPYPVGVPVRGISALALVLITGVVISVSPLVSRAQGTVGQSQTGAALATLRDGSGRVVGSALLIEDERGVHVEVEARGLHPGERGLHIHSAARCDAPDFLSAGTHFNPQLRQHGIANPQGPHDGDLPALIVQADGTARYQTTNPSLTMKLGQPRSLFDGDGSALVLHANADDQQTDPEGRSGNRVACGAIIVP